MQTPTIELISEALGVDLTSMEPLCYYYGARGETQSYFDYSSFEQGYGSWPEDRHRSPLYQVITHLDKLTWMKPGSEEARWQNQRITASLQLLSR